MARTDRVLDRLRKLCLSLPDTKETITWGTPHFRVGEKIFAGCGEEKGTPVIGFKLERDHAEAIIQDPRFWRAPYVGHKGWVSMDATRIEDWRELKSLLHESYRLIAPKRSLAQLTKPRPGAGRSTGVASKKKLARKPAARAPKSPRQHSTTAPRRRAP
jgi:predicted DNA-binding protein (MmcQ/YjbR family)